MIAFLNFEGSWRNEKHHKIENARMNSIFSEKFIEIGSVICRKKIEKACLSSGFLIKKTEFSVLFANISPTIEVIKNPRRS